MATKAKKTTKVEKLNNSLVNASMAAINTTIENGEKWQKLTKKLIKESEPVRTKQINMVYDTASAVKKQVVTGTERMMDLVGVDASTVKKAKDFATNNPVSKKVIDVTEDIKEKVSESPITKKVEKTTEDFKQMGISKYNDVREDVLEQAQKILQKGEELVEDAKNPKKTSMEVKGKGAAKVKKVRKKTTKKTAEVKKKTKAKVAEVKAIAQTVVQEVKAQGAKEVAEVKADAKDKVIAVKEETKEIVENRAKDDLKLIYGVGPKVEATFNKNGINTYGDLVKAEKSKIEAILEEAGPMFKNVDTADWKKQAEVGVEGGEEAVKAWVARYRTA